jgi:hypothetical protein
MRELITAGLRLAPDGTSITILIPGKEGPTVPVTITADQIQEALRTKQSKPYLPNLECFEGRRADFKAWIAQIWAKFSIDMGTEKEDIRF